MLFHACRGSHGNELSAAWNTHGNELVLVRGRSQILSLIASVLIDRSIDAS